MSTAAEYDQLLSQRDELRQHIGGLFEDPPSKQRDALVSYLSGELQHISRLCQDSLFSKIVAVSASTPVDTAATLPGSPTASLHSSVSASVPADCKGDQSKAPGDSSVNYNLWNIVTTYLQEIPQRIR